jgi:hypothetical protein
MSDEVITTNVPTGDFDAGGMEFALWLSKLGLSRPTGYRYRRDGKVVTHNVEGREFILTEEISRFWRRVKAGEFAKQPRGASAKARRASSPPPGHGQAQGGRTSAK